MDSPHKEPVIQKLCPWSWCRDEDSHTCWLHLIFCQAYCCLTSSWLITHSSHQEPLKAGRPEVGKLLSGVPSQDQTCEEHVVAEDELMPTMLYGIHNRMWYYYITVSFIINPQKRHHIVILLGRAMGCLLWFKFHLYYPSTSGMIMQYHILLDHIVMIAVGVFHIGHHIHMLCSNFWNRNLTLVF